MFKKKQRAPFQGPDLDALIKRTKSFDNEQILETMEVAVSNLGLYTSEYRKGRDIYILAEMQMWAEALYVAANELEGRKELASDIAPARQKRGGHY